MSSIGQAIFGGSNTSSSSSNQAYPYLQSAYSGQVTNGTDANSQLASLLGLTNPAAGAAGLQNYENSAGYQSTMNAGSQAITGNNASRGLLDSGATGQALTNFGQQTGQQYYNNYLNQLTGLSQAGTTAGSLIGGAGSTSSSSGSSKPGMTTMLGQLATGAAITSDPRLKMDVTRVGEVDGLGVYDFHYIWDEEDAPFTRGYMADEVEEHAPWALGPETDGFKTVYYSWLPGFEDME